MSPPTKHSTKQMVHIYQEKLKTQFNGESMHEQNSSKST